MIRATLATTVLSLACHGTALADECDVAADRVMQATGSTFVRQSDSVRFLRHPLLREHLSVYCGNPTDPARINVSAYWTDAHPPREFYAVTAKAGAAITGDAPAKLLPVLTQCHEKALREISADDPNGQVDGMSVGRSEIECGAFTRDDGGSDFTIGKRR